MSDSAESPLGISKESVVEPPPSPPASSSSPPPPPSPSSPPPPSASSSSPPSPSASPPPPSPSASPPPPSASSPTPPPPPSPSSSPPPPSPPSPPPPPSDKKSSPGDDLPPITVSPPAAERHGPPPESSPEVGSVAPATNNSSPPPPSDSKPSTPPPPSNSNSSSSPPPLNSGQPLPPSSPPESWTPPPLALQPPPPSPSPPPKGSSSSSPPSPPASSPPPPTPPSAVSDKLPPPPSSPPPASTNFSPPPPNSSPAQPLPAPVISYGTPPPALRAPINAIPSPQFPGSPNGPTPPSPGMTPSASSTKAPPNSRIPSPESKLIPPSIHSGPSTLTPVLSNPSPKSSSSSTAGTIIGSTLAGVVVVTMVVFVFFITRKKKKRGTPAFTGQYGPTPTNFIVEPDGYQYKQQHIRQHILVGSGQTDGFYNGRPPLSPSAVENNSGNAGSDSGGIGGSKSCFSYEEMSEVTNGFSPQNILGEGGFGCVYKGWLPHGRVVAVKQLKAGSGQGEREFRAEVEIISRVHHRHLVSLVGYCIANHHRLLVYEFLPNNNLEHHLHGKGMPVLEWSKRIKIAVGAARGLAYLHEDCHPKIIHRDIKSANILLDNAFESQVADFGLAKLTNDTNTHVSTRVMGTFGYLAPEYASSGKLTDRSDVYSFGVVLLELVTGRKPVDPTQPLGDESLVEWARPLLINALDTGDFTALVDPRLERRYVESEMFRMIEAAAACVRHSAPKRPRMAQVVRALDSENNITDLTNGVKLGQSTAYDSGQYSAEVKNFRRMAFGCWDSSDYDMSSGEATSVIAPHSSIELLSRDSESHAIHPVGNVTAQPGHDGSNQFNHR